MLGDDSTIFVSRRVFQVVFVVHFEDVYLGSPSGQQGPFTCSPRLERRYPPYLTMTSLVAVQLLTIVGR